MRRWSSMIEASMEDLRIEVGALRKAVNRVLLDSSPLPSVGIFTKPGSAAASSPAGNPADGPRGHRTEMGNWENVFGAVLTHTYSPDKDMFTELPKQLPRSSSQPQFDTRHVNFDC